MAEYADTFLIVMIISLVLNIVLYIRITQLLYLEAKGQTTPYQKLKDSKYYNESRLTTPKFNDSEIRQKLEKLR